MKVRAKILLIVGARPNFIKVAPLFKEFKKYKTIKPILVHTGQHYDFEMSKVFFQELKIPKSDYNLRVGSGSHTWQTAKIMEKLEPILLKEKPDLVIVFGDVNSTLAGALTAVKHNIKIAHVEAGLRSFDKTMPEEINRCLTDHISDYLFTTEPKAIENLIREGITKKRIYYVGDLMIDTFLKHKQNILQSAILNKLKLKKKEYGVLTLHRPENVDNKKILGEILESLKEIQEAIKIVWPIHPRTKKMIKYFHYAFLIKDLKNLIITSPLGYLDMLNLMKQSKFIMTDSGGIQEETTFLKVPCLTLRKVTERPITVDVGTNIVVGVKKEKIVKVVKKILAEHIKKGKIPRFWDGKTAKRILKILNKKLKNGKFF